MDGSYDYHLNTQFCPKLLLLSQKRKLALKEGLWSSYLIFNYILNTTNFTLGRTFCCDLMTIDQFVCSSAHYFQYFLDAPVPQPPSVTLYQLGCPLVPGIIHDSHTAWHGVLIPKWVVCDPALELHLSCGLSWSQLDSLESRHWDRAAKNFCGRKMEEKDYEP